MGQADGRVGLVDVLDTGPGGAESVHPDLVPVEFDFDIAFDLGQDFDQGEGRVTALLGVERADADKPVHSPLGLEEAVGGTAVHRDRDALDAGFLTLRLVEDLGAEAMALGPAQVHPQEHLGPVGGFGAARAGADRQQGVATVVLATEEEVPSGDGVLGVELGGLGGDVRQEALVAFILPQLQQLEGGLGARFEVAPQRQLLAQPLCLPQHLLRGALVIPETGLTVARVEGG